MWRFPRPPLVLWLVGVLVGIVVFWFTSVAFDMAQILGFILVISYDLSSIDISSWIASSTASLIFIFFGDLDLRLTINRKKVIGLSFIFVLVPILVLRIGVIFIFHK